MSPMCVSDSVQSRHQASNTSDDTNTVNRYLSVHCPTVTRLGGRLPACPLAERLPSYSLAQPPLNIRRTDSGAEPRQLCAPPFLGARARERTEGVQQPQHHQLRAGRARAVHRART